MENTWLKFLSAKAYRRYMDGEGEGGEGEGDGGGTGDPNQGEEVTVLAVKDDKGRVTYKSAEGKPFFTQEHLNTEIGNARKAARQKVEGEKSGLQTQLEEMRTEAQEKGINVDALTTKIQELEESSLTADELAAKRAKDLEEQFAVEKTQLTKQAEEAMGLFRNERISTEISNACTLHKVVSQETVAPLIRAQTELVEEKDRKGNITGYKAVVHFDDRDDEGKPVQRDLSVGDAVKRMREMVDRFGHLFVHETEPGSGQSTLFGQAPGAGDGPLVEGKTSQEQFNAWADKQD